MYKHIPNLLNKLKLIIINKRQEIDGVVNSPNKIGTAVFKLSRLCCVKDLFPISFILLISFWIRFVFQNYLHKKDPPCPCGALCRPRPVYQPIVQEAVFLVTPCALVEVFKKIHALHVYQFHRHQHWQTDKRSSRPTFILIHSFICFLYKNATSWKTPNK